MIPAMLRILHCLLMSALRRSRKPNEGHFRTFCDILLLLFPDEQMKMHELAAEERQRYNTTKPKAQILHALTLLHSVSVGLYPI